MGCAERNPLASGEQERRTIVKRTETFHSGPEGSTPSRQRPASQPEASLAWAVATSPMKRRQQVPKPRGSPDIFITLKPSPSLERGQHRRDRHWRGTVGSAGVAERGKGTGWVAWEPEMSHSRPRESEPAIGDRRLNKDPGLVRDLRPPRIAVSSEHEPRRNHVGTGSETNK